MTSASRLIKTLIATLLLFAFTLASSQEQPVEKSARVPKAESQKEQSGAKSHETKSANQSPQPQAPIVVTKTPAEIEQPVTHAKPDGEQKSEKKEESWGDKLIADPVAFFTCLLFVATFALWWATRCLVVGAKKSSERQLRAYVAMKHDDKLLLDPDGLLTAPIIVKNLGNTPAHELMCCLYICLHKWPLDVALDPSAFPEKSSKTTLAPGEQIRLYAVFPKQLNELEIEAIITQVGAIVVWGEVRYIDAFGKQRSTNLCLFSTGSDFGRGELAYHHHGNESD